MSGSSAARARDARPKELPPGYWDEASADAVLGKTLEVKLAPDLSTLTAPERAAVKDLLAAGGVVQKLYEISRHPQALEAHAALEAIAAQPGAPPLASKLLDLYRLFQGPIATTLDNRRVPFLPVAAEVPGKNVYPADLSRAEMDAYLKAHPGQREELLDLRGVVRRATAASLDKDLDTLRKYPVLDVLHPGLEARLEALAKTPSRDRLYGVPYSVNWPAEILEIYGRLNEAADAIQPEDDDFARYLRDRSRDLLVDDYDAGDAAWVTGRFRNLNAQIGSYETYDDELYGVRTFFSLSLLKRDNERSEALRRAVKGLQQIEDMLPYDAHKQVREEIPIGLYDVIADFGQSRGSNTASILPNESHLARRYGRTILLRANIMSNPAIFEIGAASFRAAVDPSQSGDLTSEGNLQRTLWHEIGHYLGVDRTADGRELDAALQDSADLYEEMKADLVSLFAVQPLLKQGYYDAATARSVYAGGVLRVLQKNRPRREQPYQTMELMQWNYFLEKGLLVFDPATGTLHIDYAKYPDVVRSLLAEILSIQREGNKERAESFIKKYTSWREDLHGVVAKRMRAAERYRYVLVRFAAVDE